MTLARILLMFIIPLILTACNANVNPYGTKVDEPIGPDGMRVQDYEDLGRQRARYALQMQAELGVLSTDPDIQVKIVMQHLNHPTVSVKYSGKPPKGIFKNMKSQLSVYKKSVREGDTIIYDTDLAQMTMIMERFEDGVPYDYRELTAIVPYGFCLDFIEENLGKEKNNYILRKVICTQSGLGLAY